MQHNHSILGMVTINDKGQVVIPAEARTMMNLKTADKLLVLVHPSHEGLVLVKPDGLESFARQMLEQVNDAREAADNEQPAA